MSREIKFRVWNPSGNNMLFDIDNVYECLKQQLTFDNTQPDRGFTAPYNHKGDGMAWMQFTGFKDKNGKEVYEGDIVDCDMSFNGGVLPHRGEIVFINRFGAFATKNQAGYTLLHNHILSSFVLLGNIYENPELLK